ncbi:hypothetical protein CIPAW_02G003400 [Carya illinoinensis]|uniref:NPH3 domain-containing protein n=1 Tax=Carya illinoinensis TaxID=32201 RepID=A0A8T1RAJ5_CARIL|nr:hypothetical protein CIPAW_02G003400 [Carya illinoinensis]
MKLGSKPDSFQTDGDNIRYVATELATDIVINMRDVKFYLHKFPLLSKSALTLNAYNVVAARCAAEYLEMYETIEKGNLIYKIDVFLNSSVFRSWKDSIIVLQTTKSLLPWSKELKVVSHCLDSIASKASIDTSKNGVRKQQLVPKDWWVEDLCDLQLDLYKLVITTIKTKGKVSDDVIGEALNAYALRRLLGFSKGIIQGGDTKKNRSLVDTIVQLLPTEKGSVSCSFLIKLLRAATMFESASGKTTPYDVDIVQNLVKEFVMHVQNAQIYSSIENEFQEIRISRLVPDASKAMVAKLVDGYLAEVACDPSLLVSKFVSLAEMGSSFSRPSHDGLYRAIDMYLKEHSGISKSERKTICRLMDCRKSSAEACLHAVQNEWLPLRVVVQVLFFKQLRATTSAGNSTPVLPGLFRALLPAGSHGKSRSTTINTEEDWDAVPIAEDIKALKGELTTLRLGGGEGSCDANYAKSSMGKVATNKMKGLVMSKLFSKLWSSKERNGEINNSDTLESPGSTNADKTKSTPS